MSKLISVIVPVYNVKKWLPICLDSISNQQDHDWEVVMVDDESTDGSLAVCARYASMDRRFRFVSQRHSGLGAAYNLGLQVARGDLITMVPGDDLVDPKFLSRARQALDQQHADIAVTNFTQFNDQQQATVFHQLTTTPGQSLAGVYKPFEWAQLADRKTDWLDLIYHVAYGKLYRRQVFDSVMFPANNFPDDMTVWKCYLNAQQIAYLPESLYCKRIHRQGSLADKGRVNLSLAGIEAEITMLSILGADIHALANVYRHRLHFVKDHALAANQLWAYQDAVDKLAILDRFKQEGHHE